MPQPAPVSTGDRLETLDVLRGFALLGILAMNIRAMAAPFSAYMNPQSLFEYAGASRAAYMFTSIVFDLKMMGLFSMLFGAGVLLYAAKPSETVKTVRGLWFRRMFWLLVIGLIHAYLIWDGDILVPYALCGLLVLWWVRRLSPALLLAGAVLFLSIGALLGVGHATSWNAMSAQDKSMELEMWAPTPEQVQAQLEAMHGTYPQVVAHRASFVFMAHLFYFPLFFLWRCGGMMLLGMALFKWGFLDGRRTAGAYLATAAICVPLGLGLAWFGFAKLEATRFGMPDRLLLDLWNYAGAVFASVGYAAILILIVKGRVLAGLRRALAAVGQMAFSNYLFHSLVTSMLFLGWGFDLVGRFDYARQLGVVVAIWVFQLIVSPIWLRHFRFGPAEWAWRSLTYWKRQPMRRESTRILNPLLGVRADKP
jgi:uncharacterized protein